MSYLASKLLTSELKLDVLRQTNSSNTYTGPRRMIYTTVGTQVTSITLADAGTRLNLPAGSSYYLEASIGGVDTSKVSTAELQFYDTTTATYLGQSARLCINQSHGFEEIQGRRVARALILDSDISVVMSVALVVKSSTGTINYYSTTTGILNQPIGVPTLRIIELPS
jgi:hypothetical protein